MKPFDSIQQAKRWGTVEQPTDGPYSFAVSEFEGALEHFTFAPDLMGLWRVSLCGCAACGDLVCTCKCCECDGPAPKDSGRMEVSSGLYCVDCCAADQAEYNRRELRMMREQWTPGLNCSVFVDYDVEFSEVML